MAKLRQLLAYILCVALAAPPFAYGQANPPAAAKAPPVKGLAGVTLSATQNPTYARLLIEWPAGTNLSASANAPPNNGLAFIRLPRPVEADPIQFVRGAPDFLASAALSADKRTIRMVLLQGTRVVQSRFSNIQAFDFVLADAPDPPPYQGISEQNNDDQGQEELSPDRDVQPKKMINSPAPIGAPRVLVEILPSKEFTRLRLTRQGSQSPLPNYGYSRSGDRLAIALPGLFAFDIASLRNQPPEGVLDAARYNSATDTSLVLDVKPGSVVRHNRDGNAIVIDILPAGANSDAVTGFKQQAAAVRAKAEAKKAEAKENAAKTSEQGSNPATQSTLNEQAALTQRPDPAPSGRIKMSSAMIASGLQLEFDFQAPAASVIFRRGDSIYAMFATAANVDIGRVASGKYLSRIETLRGNGVSGVRIVAPPEVNAIPSAMGNKWRITLSPERSSVARNIVIDRERALDGTSRVKAIVPDGAATGVMTDPGVGDTLLLGLSLGPVSALQAQRSFLEATLPETYQGLAVIPRTEDFELRRSVDGFVLVRPQGMALSGLSDEDNVTENPVTPPGFVNFKSWKQGAKADFIPNLSKLRRKAAAELGGTGMAMAARLDLARFYLGWDMGPEAAGIIRQVRDDVPVASEFPDLIALEGIATLMTGNSKDAFTKLSDPKLGNDPSSQLWAGLAAYQNGNLGEARLRFERGEPALRLFEPDYRARFAIANGEAAMDLGDFSLANIAASAAQSDAQEPVTQLQAALLAARSMARLGRSDEALFALTKLAAAPDPEIAARASYEKVNLGLSTGKINPIEAIRILDGLRFAWRGDDLEIDVLRLLGSLYIQVGDVRSGLSTMASAMTLRPELPAARRLRIELADQFKQLFLEGGADGMDPIQALALFYDFRNLAPIGPDGDRMVRGLAERLVALDLLPQATQLLQHQVDKRLEGFAKAQVSTDLAAIYMMDRRPEDALRAIWNSRVALLPEALNQQRRLIEAASLAELGRRDHALETIEFDGSRDAARLRTEIYMRAKDWPNAAANARATLPPVQPRLSPEDAGEVLRVAVTQAMARETANNRELARTYGPAMAKSANAEAFKVLTDTAIPSNATLVAAVNSVTSGSPYDGLMRRLRTRLNDIEAPIENQAIMAENANGVSDGNPTGKLASTLLAVLPEGLRPKPNPEAAKPPAPLMPPLQRRSAPITKIPPPLNPEAGATRPVTRPPIQNQPKATPKRANSRPTLDAPRDPPPDQFSSNQASQNRASPNQVSMR
ncbi:tetratricopeptide repeat protein [Candidatus Phycosocius spiralis]|uniref:Tetratricopeptide repeat protein n=1 Tax=Candidatus Phycosocius spiralis TaxID=2815099 RepID=A0ABQ4PWN9_9PROT|nr:hypothetical protein [Candidatus Phycosocius spiralis]GIU67438.1 hypothetical protein PsB1_1592 [Candidatus Phycosocius spiralis]